MQITLSERAFSERIRDLEGLGANVGVEEIEHRLGHYATKLFQHLQNYGVHMMANGYTVSGSLATIHAVLDRCHDEESRALRLQGLSMLNPLSVSMEQQDVGAFFAGMALTSMYSAWDSYGYKLQRLTVPELEAALEQIAPGVIFAQPPQPNNPAEAFEQEMEFQNFLLRAGKKDPLEKHRAVDVYRQREEAAVEEERQRKLDEFIRGQQD